MVDYLKPNDRIINKKNTSAAYQAEEKRIREKWERENPRKPEPEIASQEAMSQIVTSQGKINPKFVLPKSNSLVTPPKPVEQALYMGVNTTAGTPYYGQGDFKGWARKVFAQVFDPQAFLQNVSNKDILKSVPKAQKEIEATVNKVFKWDKWGERLFGITSKDIAASAAAINAEQRSEGAGGAVAQATGVLSRGVKPLVETALGVFQVFDYAKRKDLSIKMAREKLYAETDFAKDVENSAMYKMADKFGAAEYIFGRGLEGNAGVYLQENPIFGLINPIGNAMESWVKSMAILADPDTRDIAPETYENFWRGSSMAYTMVKDAKARQNFEEAIAAGKDPELAAIENADFWTELGGSIANDPTTYMGMTLLKGLKIPFSGGRAIGIVEGKIAVVPWEKLLIAEIPTVGQLFGLGGKAKTIAAGDDALKAVFRAAGDEASRLVDAEKGISVLDNVADQASAVKRMDEHASKIVGHADEYLKNLELNRVPNTKVLDTSTKKASLALQSATNGARMILSKAGTLDERIDVLRAVRRMFKGTIAERKAAVLLATKDLGKLAVTDSVFQLGTFLAKLEDDADIMRLARTAGGDVLHNEPLIKKIDDIAKAFYPSMDEMSDAAKLLETKADDIAKAKGGIAEIEQRLAQFGDITDKKLAKQHAKVVAELKRAKSAYASEFGKLEDYSKMYDDIPQYLKSGRAGLRAYENVPLIGSRAIKQYMNTVYLALRPAQTARQVQSQTALMLMDLGLVDAFEVMAKTTVTAFKQSTTERMLANNVREIQKVLGFKPAKFIQGTSVTGEVVNAKGFQGMLKVTQNLDELMSSEIILRTAKKEMAKLTSKPQIFAFEKLANDFTKEETHQLYRLLTEHSGDTKTAFAEFRKIVKKGTFDAWRYVPMSDNLLQFTSDTHLLEQLNELQKTAKNQRAFTDGVRGLLEATIDGARKKAAEMPPVIDADAGENIKKLFLTAQELRNEGKIGEAAEKIFTNKVNAYRFLRDNMRDAVQTMATQLRAKIITSGNGQVDEFVKADGAFQQAFNNFSEGTSDLREASSTFTETLHMDKSVSEMIDLIHTDKFNLEEMTGVALDELYAMDMAKFKNVAWTAYYEKTGAMWEAQNMEAVDGIWDAIEVFSKSMKIDIEDLIKSDGENGKVAEWLNAVNKYRQEAKVWENYSKFFSQNINDLANAYGVPTATRRGAPFDKMLLNTLNKYRGDIEAFANKADAENRIEDVRRVFARMQEAKDPTDTRVSDRIAEVLNNIKKEGDTIFEGQVVDDVADTADVPPINAVNFEKENKKTLQQLYREAAKANGWDGKNFTQWLKDNPNFKKAMREMNKKVKAWEENFTNMKGTPPVSSPGTSNNAIALYENLTDYKFTNDIQLWVDEVSEAWGRQGQALKMTPQRERAFMEFAADTEQKMAEARLRITRVAEQTRDNILLSYDKSYGDIAMAYFKPYHYWQTHQTMATFNRFLDHPSWASAYLKYKQAMASDNKDLPEWWRYNIEIKNLLGVDLKNPIFVNLESAINPIYDLTGTDFNDPYKRVDWVSRAIDDLGKTGGSFTPIIQWAVALHLYDKNHDEAANRWVGRVTGQTSTAVKAMLNKLGLDVNLGKFIQHNELDPAVNFLMGGLDPQERKRVGRAMTAMVNEGLPPEEALQAMNDQEGEVWDEAVRRSTGARANTELISYFAGVNWKPRTPQDAEIDIFYKDYYTLRNQRDMMTPEQYRAAWDNLREDYSYMDTLLLSGKNTEDRNSAYTYNVLGRIPPSQMDDVLKKFGVSNAQITAFYEGKGDFTGWTKGDKERFLSAVYDLGAFLAIPDKATKQEWDAAREMRRAMETKIATDLDITEEELQGLLSEFYDIPKSQTGQKDGFMKLNPVLQDYFDLKAAYVSNNPLLGAYYGGLDTVERYQKSIIRGEMESKYGQDIFQNYYEYLDLFPDDREAYKKANKDFSKFLDEYYNRLDQVPLIVAGFSKNLQEGKPVQTWTTPGEGTQQEMLDTLSPAQRMDFSQWRQAIGEPMTEVIVEYSNGEEIPYQVRQRLEKLADQFGYNDANSLLAEILRSMNQ